MLFTVSVSTLLASGQPSTILLVQKSQPSGFVLRDKLLVNSALWPQAVTSAYHTLSYQSEAQTLCTFSCHGDVHPPAPTRRWTFHLKLKPAWQTLFQQLVSLLSSSRRLEERLKRIQSFSSANHLRFVSDRALCELFILSNTKIYSYVLYPCTIKFFDIDKTGF